MTTIEVYEMAKVKNSGTIRTAIESAEFKEMINKFLNFEKIYLIEIYDELKRKVYNQGYCNAYEEKGYYFDAIIGKYYQNDVCHYLDQDSKLKIRVYLADDNKTIESIGIR